ncbi:MAG: hypothetical protein PV344_03875 [Anaplasma sp.]|nr:hypothetical protein [Anaplasma sp.]
MLTHCPNCSRDLYFANQRIVAKIRSSRKFSRLQYIDLQVSLPCLCLRGASDKANGPDLTVFFYFCYF